MTLSQYHQQYADQSDEKIEAKIDEKKRELSAVFDAVSPEFKSAPVRLAVLGCGDKRFVGAHKKIFEEIIGTEVEITTFDIIIDHLQGEDRIFKHDCTLPLPDTPYDITFGHVLLKFIDTEKLTGREKGKWTYINPVGRCVDRKKFEEFKTRFYNLEGWDTTTGYPTRSTLESLGLGYVADELEKNGKLGKSKSL